MQQSPSAAQAVEPLDTVQYYGKLREQAMERLLETDLDTREEQRAAAAR